VASKKRKYLNDDKRRANSFSSTGTLIKFENASLSRSFPSTSLNENKFDIDNILIPYEMMLTNTVSKTMDVNINKEILTPKWRIIEEDTDDDDDDCGGVNRKELLLTDDYFIKLHELPELKERYYTIFKKLEKEKKALLNKQDHQLIPTSKLEDLCLEEFKLLVNKLENEHKRKFNDIPQSTLKTTTTTTTNNFDLLQNCKLFFRNIKPSLIILSLSVA
jgi:hypothetical protein